MPAIRHNVVGRDQFLRRKDFAGLQSKSACDRAWWYHDSKYSRASSKRSAGTNPRFETHTLLAPRQITTRITEG